MSMQRPPFADARQLLERAKKHRAEFGAVCFPAGGGGIWTIIELFEADLFTCALTLNDEVLAEARPIVADISNNLTHALDHLVSVSARLNGSSRRYDTYFPLQEGDGKFEQALEKLVPHIGDLAIEKLRSLRLERADDLPFVRLIRQISNTGKHWELAPSDATALAVCYALPGHPPMIHDVPAGTFAKDRWFEFYSAPEPLPHVPISCVVKLTFEGLRAEQVADVDTVFDRAIAFAEFACQLFEAH